MLTSIFDLFSVVFGTFFLLKNPFRGQKMLIGGILTSGIRETRGNFLKKDFFGCKNTGTDTGFLIHCYSYVTGISLVFV